MSSAVVSTSAAQGRPFFFDDEVEPEGSCGDSRPRLSGRAQLDQHSPENHPQPWIPSKILPSTVTPASRLEIRPTPEMVSSGIPAIDALTGGLPRGCLTEICGPASSGRTTFLLAALAAATRRGEFCTVVDASDALDPHSAACAGVALDRLLWVRCGEDSPQKPHIKQNGCPISRASLAREVGAGETRLSSQAAFDFDRTNLRQSERRMEQVLRATDLLLESGGFGLIVLDLARPATPVSPPYPADHVVPLPPRHRAHPHNPAGHRATPHRRKLLLLAVAIGNEMRSDGGICREAAKECSPRRKPWVGRGRFTSPGGAQATFHARGTRA